MRKIITLVIFLSLSSGFAQTEELDSLSIQLAYQNQDSLKVNTSLKIIKLLYDMNAFDRAIKYIIESEKLSAHLNYRKGIAEITYYKALIYAQKNDYINAINGFQTSKALFGKLNDPLGVAKVNNSIGILEIKRGNFAKGMQYSLAAIGELEKRNATKDLKLAYSNLAKAFYNINAVDNAIEYYLKALDIQKQLHDAEGIYESNRYLAELFSARKEHRKAIEYYEAILNAEGKNSDSIKRTVYPKLGGEYLKFNDFDNAKKFLVKGYNLNFRGKDKSSFLTVLNNLGELNLHQNRLNLAEKQLRQAGAIAQELNNKEELLKHYKLMKALDSTKKRFDRAFIWQREYFNLKNVLDNNILNVNVKPHVNTMLDLDSGIDEDKPDNNSTQAKPTDNVDVPENQQKFQRFKLISYALLAALAIVSTFLILIYLKRNSSLKYAQELEEKNIKIQLQNEAFKEQTKHLENVNSVKDKLFSIVSHDLKDSLSSINGFINLLRDGSLSREEFDNLIPELSENANNASLLLFNLLNWSKSQMHSLKPKPSMFDIQEVFEDKVKLIEQRLENKGIALIDRSIRDFAYADKSMIEIVVQNLLANALKFSNKGDTITISNRISNGNCVISVADTGVGISQQNMDKLFKSNTFTTTGTNNEKGTGLGLSICKELVELNHGKIWVESAQNLGSTFYVQLPKSKPAD